jgi:hypothetical protein
MPIFKSHYGKFPEIPTNIIHICHVGFHAAFISIEDVMVCDRKLPSCGANAWTMTVSTNETLRILKGHGLMALM